MTITRAEVTDRGLATRLGQVVFLTKGNRTYEGRLGYVPKRFVIFTEKDNQLPVKEGDIVELRVGSCRANYESHFRKHVYRT